MGVNKSSSLLRVRFSRYNDRALRWMWEVRREELNSIDSRRKMSFNEFMNDIVSDWMGSCTEKMSEELEDLKDSYIDKLLDDSEKEKREAAEEDW